MPLKTYLNKDERDKIVFLWFMNGFIDEIVDEWGELGTITKEERKFLRMANTYTIKFVRAILDRINDKEGKRIYDKLVYSKIEIKPIMIHAEANDKTWTLKIKRDAMDIIAEGVIASWCSKCNEKDYDKCPIRHIFQETEVEKYDKFAKGCQYKY